MGISSTLLVISFAIDYHCIHMSKPVQIDVEKIFRDKNPRLARLIPGFVFRWIRKTLHETEINSFLREEKSNTGVAFACNILEAFGVKHDSDGHNNLPTEGGAIVAANHPLGGMDGMIMLCQAARARQDIGFIVNDILLNLPQFNDVFIGVNKTGAKGREQLKKIEELYASDRLVLIFPAGLCSRRNKGIVKDLEWNKAFISRAIKYQKPIIPTHITGQNSNWFYGLANFRKRLGLKANLEMFYLADEMFKQKDKKIHVRFGSPISYKVFDDRYSQHQWAQLLKDYVYTLRHNPTDFETFIAKNS
ncbi:MAG: glycerol acyltransferase [Bacteroidetes bacterium]|nr:glycerol acyltransferase [Bacteroidota bacterium]